MSAGLPPLGAVPQADGLVSFTIWAPNCRELTLVIKGDGSAAVPMRPEHGGYYSAMIEVPPGARYVYRSRSGVERPDPASRFQPAGVHEASQVVSPTFEWSSRDWTGLPLEEYVLYEIHIGTFTHEGTFDAAIGQLSRLAELGVTAVEVMPVAQFPGGRNWGYDGVYPFAVQNSYGGPDALKRFVDACHLHGLAAVLDVVYNHLGPEGNYLSEFGPYFTNRYCTPWGMAFNFDGPQSDEVRRFFIENALYWVTEFRFDALRLDAVHAIADRSAVPFLEELVSAVHCQGENLGRKILLFPESDANDSRLIRPREERGYGFDAQWSDDFHHALRANLTGENTGYYADFGQFGQIAKAWRDGYVYTGQYSRHRACRHGSLTDGIASRRFIVFSQNHDQIGNRMLGERLGQLTDFETLKLAAASVLLSPFTPLLFMGEEYGEDAPFQYFVSHSDPDLIEAVREGRKAEFAAFAWQGECPDPEAESTFSRSKIDPALRHSGRHAVLNAYYTQLLRLRRTLGSDLIVEALEGREILVLHRAESLTILNFDTNEAVVPRSRDRDHAGRWILVLDSAAARWDGPSPGAPNELSPESETVVIAPRAVLHYALRPERI